MKLATLTSIAFFDGLIVAQVGAWNIICGFLLLVILALHMAHLEDRYESRVKP